ncbi:TPA: hypothetical protein N0F65_005260 [Lagenidium giganteum]|uniref:Myb-like domain-containing protein n=1 Tax=Lagenidium giganteum TaxID=4803 RepID=A0AAV2YXG8_9STRA|nr:TPA: hypothetical protein N0F65_005260 [Lagenidium giganteum]
MSQGKAITSTDLTRHAELVVMDYLRSWKCSKALDLFMSKTSSKVGALPSTTASDLFAEDLEKKRRADGHVSVLEHMIRSSSEASLTRTAASDQRKNASASSGRVRRRTSVDKDGDVVWSKEEVSLLKKAIKKTSDIADKNERWKQIAVLVGNDKTKKHCYVKYKELKEEKSSKGASREQVHPTPVPVDSKAPAPVQPTPTVVSAPASTQPIVQAPVMSTVVTVPEVTQMRKVEPAVSKASVELTMEDCEDFDAVGPAISRTNPSAVSEKSAVHQASLSSSSSSNEEGRVPTPDEIEALRRLMFPDDKFQFSSHWDEQGFLFSDVEGLRYGLVQHEGGPCGVLAVVQAYLIRFLLGDGKAAEHVEWQNPDTPEQQRALVSALAHIIWQAAGRQSKCTIVLNNEKLRAGARGKRKFMEGVLLHTVTSPQATEALFKRYWHQFSAPRGNGLVLFVLSVVLSKGVEAIKAEMDEVEGFDGGGGGKLIGGHDYCTQEMVNLLLIGLACSNVFNGRQLLEGASEDDPKAVVLKGIPSQGAVGFLSLFEAYEYLVVGSFLKSPKYNVWVVCSESHYSVLFTEPTLLQDGKVDDRHSIDLFYYDGLANQDEVIRLSVDAFALEEKVKPKHDDLIPPLNLVIQTKWPLAAIDWNGVEPWL